MLLIRKAFKRLHYPIDVIAQCVRWYLTYALSLRNLEDMLTQHGVIVDHSTLHRWVMRLAPLLDKTFRQYKRNVGRRWRMDETYIKIKGQWKYLYHLNKKYHRFDIKAPSNYYCYQLRYLLLKPFLA